MRRDIRSSLSSLLSESISLDKEDWCEELVKIIEEWIDTNQGHPLKLVIPLQGKYGRRSVDINELNKEDRCLLGLLQYSSTKVRQAGSSLNLCLAFLECSESCIGTMQQRKTLADSVREMGTQSPPPLSAAYVDTNIFGDRPVQAPLESSHRQPPLYSMRPSTDLIVSNHKGMFDEGLGTLQEFQGVVPLLADAEQGGDVVGEENMHGNHGTSQPWLDRDFAVIGVGLKPSFQPFLSSAVESSSQDASSESSSLVGSSDDGMSDMEADLLLDSQDHLVVWRTSHWLPVSDDHLVLGPVSLAAQQELVREMDSAGTHALFLWPQCYNVHILYREGWEFAIDALSDLLQQSSHRSLAVKLLFELLQMPPSFEISDSNVQTLFIHKISASFLAGRNERESDPHGEGRSEDYTTLIAIMSAFLAMLQRSTCGFSSVRAASILGRLLSDAGWSSAESCLEVLVPHISHTSIAPLCVLISSVQQYHEMVGFLSRVSLHLCAQPWNSPETMEVVCQFAMLCGTVPESLTALMSTFEERLLTLSFAMLLVACQCLRQLVDRLQIVPANTSLVLRSIAECFVGWKGDWQLLASSDVCSLIKFCVWINDASIMCRMVDRILAFPCGSILREVLSLHAVQLSPQSSEVIRLAEARISELNLFFGDMWRFNPGSFPVRLEMDGKCWNCREVENFLKSNFESMIGFRLYNSEGNEATREELEKFEAFFLNYRVSSNPTYLAICMIDHHSSNPCINFYKTHSIHPKYGTVTQAEQEMAVLKNLTAD